MSASTFLPLLDSNDEELINATARCGPVLLPAQSKHSLPTGSTYFVLPDVAAPPSVDQIATWLDGGASKVVISMSLAKEIAGTIPADKLVLLLDAGSASAVTDKVRATVSSVLLKTPSIDNDLLESVMRFFKGLSFYVLPSIDNVPTAASIRTLKQLGVTLTSTLR